MSRATARNAFSSYVETPVARALARVGVSPNAITLSGLAVAGVSAYLLGQGQLAAGGAVLIVSGALDLFDGAVARVSGRATAFGALLDSVTDRVSEAAVLFGLLIFFLGDSSHFNSVFSSTLGAVLVYVALAGSVLVSYVRARAEGLGAGTKVGIMTRPERVATLGIGTIVGGLWWLPAVSLALALIGVLTILTSFHRVLDARKALAEAQARDQSRPG